jgi:hypothetical protein
MEEPVPNLAFLEALDRSICSDPAHLESLRASILASSARTLQKRFAGGGGVSGRPTPSLAEASELGWTVDNYPPRDLLKLGKIL